MLLTIMHVLYKFFFFNDTATTEIYTLSLHDALPISLGHSTIVFGLCLVLSLGVRALVGPLADDSSALHRSEEHTSELQSRLHLVCRLLLEKKKNEKTGLNYGCA